jgi:hypothetical protein
MSERAPRPGLQSILKEHTTIAASLVSIVVGILGIAGYFASTGGDSQPDVHFGTARFGIRQATDTLLPLGDTVAPGGDVRVCPPDSLYAWVSHDLPDGEPIAGEWLRDEVIIANERVVASRQAPNFWMRLQRPQPGEYAFRVSAGGTTKSWAVTVVC